MSYFFGFKYLSLIDPWYHMGWRDIIRLIFLSLLPECVKTILSYSVSDLKKFHVYCSGSFYSAVIFTILFAVVLYVATNVGGRDWPIYAREVGMDVDFWQFSNNLPNFASVADDMKFIIMLHYTCTGLLSRGIACIGVLNFFLEKNPLDLLRASGSEM